MTDKPKPICKIAQETGTVPIACLFECKRQCKEAHEQEHLDKELGFDEVDEK